MQENYVSLDPANAEMETFIQRRHLWNQRVYEAQGGEVGLIYKNTLGVTFGLCSFSYLRSTGFRMFPIQMRKTPYYGGLFFACYLG